MQNANGEGIARCKPVYCLHSAFCISHCSFRPAAQGLPQPSPRPLHPIPFSDWPRTSPTATHAPGVQRAAWGIVVQSLDRGEPLFELNPRTLLVPASTAKLVSLAAAVDAVGWDFRFETTVRATAAGCRWRHSGRPDRRRVRRPVDRRTRRRRPRRVGRPRSRRSASVESTAASSATTTASRNRARSWRGPGMTSDIHQASLFGALNCRREPAGSDDCTGGIGGRGDHAQRGAARRLSPARKQDRHGCAPARPSCSGRSSGPANRF